jgi:hypothetical protein
VLDRSPVRDRRPDNRVDAAVAVSVPLAFESSSLRPDATNVVDLMDALHRSVEAARTTGSKGTQRKNDAAEAHEEYGREEDRTPGDARLPKQGG